MTPFVFDTLSASKRLREAGMEEGVAEAVVSVFQHAAAMPDISHLATKDDLEGLRLAAKTDVEMLRSEMTSEFAAVGVEMASEFAAVRAEMASEFAAVRAEMTSGFAAVRGEMASEFAVVRSEMATKSELHALEIRLMKQLQTQTWAMIGVMSGVIGLSTAVIKLFP
ncbi:DUF1640 domain-containing protein [Caulobacter mirabilis]|uniref:DUF1640 domain-containing protein n=1 Tax=Caulobacter mirabilis TaxID=69666 RepID=A0A2D2AXI7_9CAUL|nr:DUF1640 domain-containing protein [Caulobacter mirabilis]ATQ42647.1 hypothetical protein CSW64_09615 [Caulobacter mirabilis]